MQLPPVAVTTVGSLPRPAWLAVHPDPARPNEIRFALEGPALPEALDDASVLAIQEQEAAGLDLISDGEQRRLNFIDHMLAGMEGFDLAHLKGREIRRRAGRVRLVPTVMGKVGRHGPILVDDLRFLQARTNRPVKMTVPGPMTVVDTTVDEAYGDEAALAMDYAVALNAELLDLQAAGADVLQIDEPAMTRHHEKVASYGAEALDRALEGITVPTIVHLCYGYPSADPRQHEYEYPDLLPMLMGTRIGGFSLEFARSGYDPALLKGCGDRLVMFGCVDPGNSPPEPLDLVLSRIRTALEFVEPERLLIAPDCGLVTISRDLARRKMELLVEAGRAVRDALGAQPVDGRQV
ncbi:MAG TPA: 5-methyltetrahydropteroyltriglutamate--homocysteine methyltransferase [Chloroflexota bacterium]